MLLCPLTDCEIDEGDCLENIDIIDEFISDESHIPDWVKVKTGYKEICKSCKYHESTWNSSLYIHFGSPHFEPERFMPALNGNWTPKPRAHTGLWGSRVDDKFGWETWCRREEYRIEALDSSFWFILPGARILSLSELEDLIPLPKIHPWEIPDYDIEDSIPDINVLNGEYVSSWCYLDFEKLAEEYDAIELRNSAALDQALHCWDCNCILVLKADKLREII